jgi:crotonobetainyl-CoA:carnitine CoA-transferase CaiB-like acyl-CoA transferase
VTGPLHGLQVVDFSRVLAGPLCARTLQDLGADVIKVEPPNPDVSRLASPIDPNGVSGYYTQQNAGKRNISINLNVPEAREIAFALCDRADFVVENFRPGTLDAFGLDYESVARRNPRIIYISISGYGQHGPFRGRMAYAPTVQAEAGFTHHSLRHFGENLGAPQTDALSHADCYSGLQGVIAALAALRQREVTGRGQHVDVSMAATIIAINERAHVDLNHLELDGEPAILGATDGSFFVGPGGEDFISAISLVGTITFRFFRAAMRRPDLVDDPRFATATLRRENLDALKAIVQAWIYSFSDMAALDAQFDEAKIAIGEIRSLEEVAKSEWGDYWTATYEVSDRQGGTLKVPGRPWKFSDADLTAPGDPAMQGEHNAVVLTDLGYDPAEIERLTQVGALVDNFAAVMIANVLSAAPVPTATVDPDADRPSADPATNHHMTTSRRRE